jgi:hypothetical protein
LRSGVSLLTRSMVLYLVNSDFKMSVSSMGGSKYFVTFIYYISMKVWVYVFKTKDQVLSVFKVMREIEKKIKCFHIDNGGQYIGSFDAYCKK